LTVSVIIHTSTFAYDLADRKTRETRPMGQATEYSYYANGLLKTLKDAKGQTTTYTYDSVNRLTEITYSDSTKDTFAYDAEGNMTSYAKPGVSSVIAYDELGRKTEETVTVGGISKTYRYTYDAAGNKQTFTSPEGKQYSYNYNKNNQVTSITTDSKTITLDYQWIRQTKTTLPNNVTTNYQYNANSWLAAIETKQNANPLSSTGYQFDKVGNITAKLGTGDWGLGTTTYGYDKLYQLINSTNSQNSETFSYDKTGNRTDSTVNANNELTQSPDATYTHDANGNTVTRAVNGQNTAYSYDARDRLTGIMLPDGKLISYTYDPFGRRISKNVNGTITHYIYADEGLIGEYAADGTNQKAYTWQPDSTWGTNPVTLTTGNSTYYYHNDHLGTPQKITDEQGTVVWSATYSAFGKATVTGTITSNLRYPGQYYDEETGLHYNWQRYYDPAEGRYVSVDPIGFEAGDENLYRYVFNDPANLYDPTGEALPVLVSVYARCVMSCMAQEAVGNAITGQCTNIKGVAKDCAVGCLNPMNWFGKKFKALNGLKRGPKTDPNAPHNKKIREIAAKIIAEGGKILSGGGGKERTIRTPGGYKDSRRPDILYRDKDGVTKGVNVGRTKSDGVSPVKRETEALKDLNDKARIPTSFESYIP